MRLRSSYSTTFKFVEEERTVAFEVLCAEEKLYTDKLKEVIDTYLYDGRKPLNDDVAGTLQIKPKLLERKTIIPRVLDKIVDFVEKFYDR
ncbi:MAG: hypothetical protein PHQ70_10320 [Arcobacter sp.]|jgi:type I restriction enzyme R subunit|uniref:type I restriction endonuclease subunit R, EcoR124 family n=1 Tax=Arcobacter sp. TaxID=1872629 RepID=UPI002583F70A|nr:hypothetical protein [Arcobacter sp.]MDD3009245.1 hypothetical protein [Arcobacter sp.]MDY0052243.1 hypothetical protein [Aliarcobacter sp.]